MFQFSCGFAFLSTFVWLEDDIIEYTCERFGIVLVCASPERAASVNPLTPTVGHMGTTIKHPVSDRVKPSFVFFDIWAL